MGNFLPNKLFFFLPVLACFYISLDKRQDCEKEKSNQQNIHFGHNIFDDVEHGHDERTSFYYSRQYTQLYETTYFRSPFETDQNCFLN